MKDREHRPIFGGLYLISEDGDLYSVRSSKYLRSNMDRYGYLYYVISIEGFRYTLKAHRLVAEQFLDNPEQKPTVNHKNGKRDDNRVHNLEWATYKEQQDDPLTKINRAKVDQNTDFRAMGQVRNFGRRKTAVYDGKRLLGIYPSLKTAAMKHSVNYGKASECANGKRKSTGGVQFCYV